MIEETSEDISAELRELSRGAKYCELQPKVFGKPIGTYFAELADRIDAAGKRARKSGHVSEMRAACVKCPSACLACSTGTPSVVRPANAAAALYTS